MRLLVIRLLPAVTALVHNTRRPCLPSQDLPHWGPPVSRDCGVCPPQKRAAVQTMHSPTDGLRILNGAANRCQPLPAFVLGLSPPPPLHRRYMPK
ncbi:hypothetical protein BZA05DRAFT_50367 [Tricharina praecox]|uniref:uncharacterized protein n=1 Tax=Tricharina praecox TaxID=43433 RepID=UPI00221F6CD7|nr:uncharacterized protein BZA05DRAFT_50367 [Tricharina praecox]KAI5852040.1 hypothetical protein BZA05DRAFT_50367 [Tricharina praecox]